MQHLDRIGTEPNVLAIPWITARRTDGKPIFSGNNEGRRIQAIQQWLCGQCGQPLDYWMVFFGDDKAVRRRIFTEPAAHRECAEYAAANCPYMANSNYQMPNQAHVEQVPGAQLAPWIVRSQPPEEGGMWLYLARGYDIDTSDQLIRAKAHAPKSITSTGSRATG